MTVHLPLEGSTPFPTSPVFLTESMDRHAQLSKVMKTIMKAKRIVVICGAGVSVRAGIPDFRSSEGLFKTLKRDNPREALASGKDLFDASVFNSEHTTSLFCQMIAQLSGLSQAAEPTAFHRVLRALDEQGKLLRVYTQNIDSLEQKCGLSFGVPEFKDKRGKSRNKSSMHNLLNESEAPEPSASETSSPGSPSCAPGELPRCIPLHGTLQMLHCQICTHSFPLEDHIQSLFLGQPPQCPECTSIEEMRQLVGKRARGIGRLRPSVVLYNEAHKDGEGVGEAVRRDLIGSSKGKGRSGADLLLVVGTSLRVPGTKRMVREFAKAVKARGVASSGVASGPSNPFSPRRSPSSEEDPAMKAIYLNLDFPVPTREWEGVFDTWIQGDAQLFANTLQDEIAKEVKAKDIATERKRKRAADTVLSTEDSPPKARISKNYVPKHSPSESPIRPFKQRKIVLLPSPPKTPKNTGDHAKDCKISHKNGLNTSKLILRIPARPCRTCLVPEVYIASSPPQTPPGKSRFEKGQPPLTPEPSPRVRPRHNLATKAGRKAARAERALRTRSKPVTPKKTVMSIAPPVEHEVNADDDDESCLLPQSFLRTVQYGLRTGAG